MANIVWQNTQIPNFGGALGALNQSTNQFNKIVGNFKQGLIDKEDRKIAADDRAFKREGDLLSRDLTNQQIAQGMFEEDNRQAKFDLAQDAVSARINSSNQSAATNAFNLGQSKEQSAREAKQRSDLQKVYNQKLALGDEVFDSEDARNQDAEFLQKLNASPETAIKALEMENALTAPSDARVANDANVEKLRLEAREDAQKAAEQENKLEQKRITANAKKKGKGGSYVDSVGNSGFITDKTQGSVEGTTKLLSDMDIAGGYEMNGRTYNIPKQAVNSMVNSLAIRSNAGYKPGDTNVHSDELKGLIEQYIKVNNL